MAPSNPAKQAPQQGALIPPWRSRSWLYEARGHVFGAAAAGGSEIQQPGLRWAGASPFRSWWAEFGTTFFLQADRFSHTAFPASVPRNCFGYRQGGEHLMHGTHQPGREK
jgi:hypothetical protein